MHKAKRTMKKQRKPGSRAIEKAGLMGDKELHKHDWHRLNTILKHGFTIWHEPPGFNGMVAHVSEYEVKLKEGVSKQQLHDFLMKHLEGSPLPGNDPEYSGRKNLQMCTAAAKKGLVTVEKVFDGNRVVRNPLMHST